VNILLDTGIWLRSAVMNISFEDVEKQFREGGGYDELNSEHNYHKSYRCFVEYFKDLDTITEDNFIIAANFTYGWMPTILNFKPDSVSKVEFGNVLALLNKAKGSTRLSEGDILKVKALVNNSIVGTSKLLHFINPEVYAIWDSHVCRFWTGESSSYQVGTVKLFEKYLDGLSKVPKSSALKKAQERFKDKLGYEVSHLRVIETMMFTLGKDLKD